MYLALLSACLQLKNVFHPFLQPMRLSPSMNGSRDVFGLDHPPVWSAFSVSSAPVLRPRESTSRRIVQAFDPARGETVHQLFPGLRLLVRPFIHPSPSSIYVLVSNYAHILPSFLAIAISSVALHNPINTQFPIYSTHPAKPAVPTSSSSALPPAKPAAHSA